MKLKKILFGCFLFLIFLAMFIFVTIYLNEKEEKLKSEMIQSKLSNYKPLHSDSETINNHWYYNLDKLDKNNQCVKGIIEQIDYLKNEKLSELITSYKYPANIYTSELKDIDIFSSNSARMFRTAIRYDLESQGVNFAGHYTITSVGMTGWGENYWIIDRENGKAYEFPYQAEFIDFRKDSNLIIINPKDKLLEFMKDSENYSDVCLGGLFYQRYYELRPSYVLWENNEAKVIDNPQNIKPTENPFFGGFWK
jgi:hypothetical protein